MAGLHFGSGIDTSQFSKDVDKMRKEILSLTKEGENVDLFGLSKQIDIQKEAIKGLEQQYKETQKQIDSMPPGAAQADLIKEHKQIGVALEDEKRSLETLEQTYKSFNAEQVKTRTRQREIRHELYDMAAAGKENTTEFFELTQELEKLDQSVDSVRHMRQTLRKGGAAMEVFTGSIRAGTGAFTALSGVSGLVNDQSERFQEIQTRLQSVMSISIGIEQTHQALLKEGSLIQSVLALQARARAKAEQLATKNTIGATVAQKAFNAVAKANPYVILATAIASVGGALLLFTRRNQDAVKQQRELNKAIAEGVSESVTQFKLLQNEYNRLGDNIKAQDEFIKKNKSSFESLGLGINDALDAEKAFVDNTSSVLQAMKARAKGEALQDLAKEQYKVYQENLANQEEVNKKLADRNLIQGVKTGWSRIFNIDEPIDKANNALDEFHDLIEKSQDELDFSESLIKSTGLDVVDDKDDPTKKTEEKRTKTLEEELSKRKKLWDDYHAAVKLIGKEAADNVYESEIDVDSSFVEELRKQRNEIQNLDEPTKKQTENLLEYQRVIDDLLERKSPFEKQKDEIKSSLKEIENYGDQIEFLRTEQEKLGDSSEEIKLFNFIEGEVDEAKAEREKMYDDALKEHESYNEKRKAITDKYNDLIAQAEEKGDSKAAENFNETLKKELSKIDAEELKVAMPDWDFIFQDLEYASAKAIENAIRHLKRFQEENKDLDLTELKELQNAIIRGEEALNKKKPFSAAISSYDNLKQSIKETSQAQEEYNRILDRNEVTSNKAVRAGERLAKAQQKEAKDRKELVKGLKDSQAIINETGRGLADFADKLGTVGDEAQKAINDITQLASSAMELGIGITSGDPLSIISGGMGILSGIGSLFQSSSSNTLERSLDKLNDRINLLDSSMRSLTKNETFQIQAQKIDEYYKQLLKTNDALDVAEKYMDRGNFGWGSIGDKISGEATKDQQELLGNIRETMNQMTQDILRTDAEGIATQLADAFVDAAQQGEDAFDALDDKIEDVMRNIVKQSLALQLTPLFQDWIDDLLQQMGVNFDDPSASDFTQLTEKQIKEAKKSLEGSLELGEGVLTEAMSILDNVFGEAEESAEKADTLQGAIQGMSQETADVLAGQFNQLRIDTSSIVSIMISNEGKLDMNLVYLSNIDSNTAGIWSEIRDLNSKIDSSDIRSSGL